MLIGTAPYVVSTQAQKPSIRMALTALNLLAGEHTLALPGAP